MTVKREGAGVLDPNAVNVQVHSIGVPKVDDKVITIPPDSILRDPEVQFEAKQTGYIAIEGGRNVLNLLIEVRDWVDQVLGAFVELIAGYALEVDIWRAVHPRTSRDPRRTLSFQVAALPWSS